MSASHIPSLDVTVMVEGARVTARIAGDLDRGTHDDFLEILDPYLGDPFGAPSEPEELHMDFRELSGIDSMGLSALLMIRRRTDTADIRLSLDNRPDHLERLLNTTGTLAHLTAPRGRGHGYRQPGTG
jgi:anti-anti-sigma factor